MIRRSKSIRIKNLRFEKEQNELLKFLSVPHENESFSLQKGDLIFCVDVQYIDRIGYLAIDVSGWESEHFMEYVIKEQAEEEYEPGYFAFREGPLIIQALSKLKENFALIPSLLIVNGHGTAHPRKMGLACWVGIKSGMPTIGVAKESLIPINYTLEESAGSVFKIEKKGEIIGTVLRTQTGKKPIFVSSGHLISQRRSAEIIFALRGQYRTIEPMRRADQTARKYAKGIIEENMIEFS